MNTRELRTLIMEQLELQGLAPEVRDQIVAQFIENLLQRLTLAMYGKLPESARAEFAKLGDAGNSEALSNLCNANIPDLDNLVRAEIAGEVGDFRKLQTAS